jgi:LysM repeat protein
MKLSPTVLLALVLFAPTALADRVHVVERGETLYSIARSYGIPLEVLIGDNDIRDVTRVPAGTRLAIRDSSGAQSAGAAQTTFYTVRKGDTLWSISQRLHVPLDQITALNAGVDADRLAIGAALVLPAGTGAPDAAPAARVTPAVSAPAASTAPAAEPRLGAPPNQEELWPHAGTRTPVTDKHFQHMAIAAKVGDPVVAVASGDVRSVSPYRGYGIVVIIEARAAGVRGAFHFWYAGLDDVYVRAGDRIAKGATIARVGLSGIESVSAKVAFGVYQGLVPVDHTRYVWQ